MGIEGRNRKSARELSLSGLTSVGTPLYDYTGCRAIDRDSIQSGLAAVQLMGQAALASLYRLRHEGEKSNEKFRAIHPGQSGRIFILCGPGNNGGDGFALAYHLLGDESFAADILANDRLQVFASGETKTEAASFYRERLERAGLKIQDAGEFLSRTPRDPDMIIEALLGIGQNRPPREKMTLLAERLVELRAGRKSERPALVALDVPLGLREDTFQSFVAPGRDRRGRNGDPCLPCPDEIHSYGVEKIALRLNRDLAAHSKIIKLPMGFAPDALRGAVAESLEEETLPERSGKLPDRLPGKIGAIFLKQPEDHKYSSGHALFIGGSASMEGAGIIAIRAFFAAGGGILHALSPDSETRRFMTGAIPTAMFLDPAEFARRDLYPAALAVGPGLSSEDFDSLRLPLLDWLGQAKERYESRDKDLPGIILDAGALGLILDENYPEELRSRTLLTPHTGEWGRLGGPPCLDVESFKAAVEFNQNKIRAWTLVKDAVSCLLPPPEQREASERARVYSRPNPALAVAGSGDALTGMLLAAFARSTNRAYSPAHLTRAALVLHTRAAARSIHPRAEEFGELAREVLKSDGVSL